MSERKLRIERAKELLPISKLWTILGCHNEPKIGSCKSPFREDRKPSFIITESDQGWSDFSTGRRGDAVDFIEEALGIGTAAAMVKLLDLSGLSDERKEGEDAPVFEQREVIEPIEFVHYKTRAELELPTLYAPTDDEITQIAGLRELSYEAVEQAAFSGLLWTCEFKDKPAWVITDRTRCNAQARRMDGQMWSIGGNEAKAWTIKGSLASWPVGIAEAYEAGGLIVMCEGGPDLLAANQLLIDNQINGQPIAFLGAAMKLHPGAKMFFRNRKVVLVPHNDAAGLTATYGVLGRNGEWQAGWVDALADVDCKLSVRELPFPVKDLNDYVKIPLAHRPKMLDACAL